VHRGQVAVDPKARCVAACLAERAEGYEGDALAPLLDRVRFLLPELASVGADQGFAAERVWANAAERRIVAYIADPQPRERRPEDERVRRDVILIPQLAKLLCEHRMASLRKGAGEFLFPAPDGRGRDQRSTARAVERRFRRAGLRVRDCPRTTCGTRLPRC
jgi:hypothetical protein